MNKVIKFLKVGSFGSFKGWVTDQQNLNPVFVASFKHPDESRYIDMYGKLYSLNFADRSIFNEIVGYLVADALGIPQPKYACVALVDTRELIQNDIIGLQAMPIGKELSAVPCFPVFCTSKIDKSQTAFAFHQQTSKLINELSKWKHMGKAAAMDNTIAHIDRHMRNVLRTGKNSYHLIDNGRLVNFYASGGWETADLNPTKKFDNLLFNLARDHFKPSQFINIKSKMVHETELHEAAIDSVIEEVKYWINILYNQAPQDYNAFIDFLQTRAKGAVAHSRSRAELLI